MSPRVRTASFRVSNPNVLLLSVGIMLASSIIPSVGAAKNTMSVPQCNHADAMAKITLTAPHIDMNVFALNTNEYGNQLWTSAGVITRFSFDLQNSRCNQSSPAVCLHASRISTDCLMCSLGQCVTLSRRSMVIAR